MHPFGLLTALVVLGLDGGTAAPRITDKNWSTHPDVESARRVYAEVRAALDAGRLSTREVQDCTQEFSSFTVATDAAGIIRLLVRDFGGEDSSQTAEAYYDARGRLRFIFVNAGAVPSAWVQARFWLDEAGVVIWTRRAAGGEGPGLYANDPGEYRITDPAAYVDERTRCLAEKSPQRRPPSSQP
jgi:hypothetical protein